ncbi:hypothetical protein PQI66_14425 [Corynebacterium sp. USCH3]|uniref:hypothetical protein n=1 Tax=Corynebacterium sp. USCH3 TaxID=3024840 RepID=UPI00309ED911
MSTPTAVPASLPTPVAAVLVGISRSTLTRHAESGLDLGRDRRIFPIRMGRAWVWPSTPVLDALGFPDDADIRATAIQFAERGGVGGLPPGTAEGGRRMSAAPTTITLPPWLTDQLFELHTAQGLLNAADPEGIEDALGEAFEEQLARCSELIDGLLELMDHIDPPRRGHHHRQGDRS